jgi:hypothetical protein
MQRVLSTRILRHDKVMIRRNARFDLLADDDTTLAKRRKRFRGSTSASSRRVEHARTSRTFAKFRHPK